MRQGLKLSLLASLMSRLKPRPTKLCNRPSIVSATLRDMVNMLMGQFVAAAQRENLCGSRLQP